jgi:hypothetical protein
MISYCDVLAAAVCLDEESAGVVSVELGEQYFMMFCLLVRGNLVGLLLNLKLGS